MAAAVAAATWCMAPFAARTLGVVPTAWDSLSYHLFFPASWVQAGRVELLAWPDPHNYYAYYADNLERLLLPLLAVARNDLLAKLPTFALAVACAVAAARLCVRLGGDRLAGAWAAVAVVATPAFLSWSAAVYVEPLLTFGVLAALLFALDVCEAGADDRHRILAAVGVGLGIGLAAGAKYLGAPVAVAIGALVGLEPIVSRRPGRVVFRVALALFAAALIAGGWPYLRNLSLTGNPVYPVPFAGHPGAPHPQAEWGASSILSQAAMLWERGYLWQALITPDGPVADLDARMTAGAKLLWLTPLSLVGLAALLGRAVQAARRGEPARALGAVIVVAAAGVLLWTYLRSPIWNTLGWLKNNVRFLVPFLWIGTAAGFAALSRWRCPRAVLAVVAVASLVSDVPRLYLAWPGLSGAASAVASAGVALAVGLLLWRRSLGDGRAGRAALVAVAVASLLAGPVLLHLREGARFEQLRHHTEIHESHHWTMVAGARALDDLPWARRVAFATDDALHFMALYLGRWWHRDVRYVATHDGPAVAHEHPAGDPRRPFVEAAWARNLRAAAIDALITYKKKRSGWPIEDRWATARGLERVYGDTHTRIYRIDSPVGADEQPRPDSR